MSPKVIRSGRAHVERAMRAVTVVVRDDVALENSPEMAAPEDEDAVEALAAQRSYEHSAKAFASGAWTGVRTTSEANTLSSGFRHDRIATGPAAPQSRS